MVGRRDVMIKVGDVWVEFLEVGLVFRPEELFQELGWSGNGLLDLGAGADVVPDKLEGVDEGVVLTAEFAGQLDGVVAGLLVVEEVAVLEVDVFGALQAPRRSRGASSCGGTPRRSPP